MHGDDEIPFDEFQLDVGQPHDSFFKKAFGRMDVVSPFLQQHLPPAIAETLDFSTLAPAHGNFVGQDLAQTHSDLFFSVQQRDGGQAFVWVLLEHQSSPDEWMPLRVLQKQLHIWLERRDAGETHLPAVIPLVLNQGPEAWKVSTEFADLFAPSVRDNPSFASCIPHFRHLLVDLTSYDPASEERELAVRFVLALMKCVRERDLRAFLEECAQLCDLLLNDAVLQNLCRFGFFYSLCADGHPLDMIAIQDMLKRVNSETVGKEVMSTAQKLINDGRQEGRQEGLEKGRQEGHVEAMQASVLDALEVKFDRVPDGLSEVVRAIHDEATLRNLLKSAVKADTLDAFAAALP